MVPELFDHVEKDLLSTARQSLEGDHRRLRDDHRNFGTGGTLIDGGGGEAIRDALPIPLGSLMEEFRMGGIPLTADAPAPADPAVRGALCWGYEPVLC